MKRQYKAAVIAVVGETIASTVMFLPLSCPIAVLKPALSVFLALHLPGAYLLLLMRPESETVKNIVMVAPSLALWYLIPFVVLRWLEHRQGKPHTTNASTTTNEPAAGGSI